ncbi:type II toxin-antitoxin system RelB family antitoxin [Fructobacillus ficulneus]|uniref:CopG family transcriptional regulator n=1 Tax=Fructobacillus ficulneus TaxID=157463 RepID=A0A0K8MIF1_9LACO|nr:DUF6290 family protein [Fructobacillus ficulneus]GAP00347.1 hypothetical protein FFIC_283640 [Fructobacillus ficulneus]
MTTLTLHFTEEDFIQFEKFAKGHHLTLSEFARDAMLEKIEDERDLSDLEKTLAKDDGTRYTMAEVKQSLDLES